MTGIVVAGWSAITSAGVGARHLTARVRAAAGVGGRAPDGPPSVEGFCDEPLPRPSGHVLHGFDVRAELGRKGTSSYDRNTALAVVCARDALASAGWADPGPAAGRVGVALGTSLGSFRSTSDYSRETLVQEKPYLVNPVLFPNTVMNGAAGQVAIRYGLRGVNATVTGGPLAFLNALRYACGAIDRGYADVVLTGAVEEFSPHRAWAQHLVDPDAAGATGEAAGLFLLAGPAAPDRLRAGPAGRVLAVATGFGPGGAAQADVALAGCVRRALRRADVDPGEVGAVLTGESGEDDHREYAPAAAALGYRPDRVLAAPLFGRCDAASGAVAMALLLASGRTGPALITARGADGAVGAAVVEGCADGGDDRV